MKKIFYILGAFFISSCTLYQKPKIPALHHPDYFKAQGINKNIQTNIAYKSIYNKYNWWENFHDENLNQLICLAIKNNGNYKIALKNIDIASTYVTQNMSNLFPQVNIDYNLSRNKNAQSVSPGNTFVVGGARAPGIFNLQQLAGSVSYQVDAWNQIRNSVKQAKANQTVSEADSKNVKLILISSVINTYFQINALNNNIINLTQQLKAAKEIVNLYNTQYRSGLIDYSALDDAKIKIDAIKNSIDSLKKQKQILDYTLAYLCGEYPENFNLSLYITINNNFKNFHRVNIIPSGIPAKMIANRPDIQGAYQQILSYGYLEKQSIANFLPSIDLTGNYGYASTALGELLSSANSYWSYGLFSAQYVFDYEARMSIYRRSKYQYQSAILNYKNTVLNAFKEIDSALSSYQEDNEALASYQNQYDISADKLRLANAQYQSGLTDNSIYLTSHLAYLQSEYNLTNQKLVVIEDIIRVYSSLGFGD